MTVAGAIGLQMRQVAQGKDPRPMNTKEFWGAAILAGGGLSIWGDFLFQDQNRFGGGAVETIAGPAAGFVGDTLRLTVGNTQQAAEGDDTKFASETIRFIRRYMPGGNIWYARLALDRFVFDELQKMADPEAYKRFRRIEKRAIKDYGQKYWWRPGKALPDRPPDIESAVE